MRAQDGGSGLESRLAEMWISETSALVDSVTQHIGDCSSPARIMFDQVLTELVDLDNFKRCRFECIYRVVHVVENNLLLKLK